MTDPAIHIVPKYTEQDVYDAGVQIRETLYEIPTYRDLLFDRTEKAFIVGGALIDTILGHDIKDFDIVAEKVDREYIKTMQQDYPVSKDKTTLWTKTSLGGDKVIHYTTPDHRDIALDVWQFNLMYPVADYLYKAHIEDEPVPKLDISDYVRFVPLNIEQGMFGLFCENVYADGLLTALNSGYIDRASNPLGWVDPYDVKVRGKTKAKKYGLGFINDR